MFATPAFAIGFARAAAFAAAMPLGRARSVPRVTRVIIAVALTPLFAQHVSHADANVEDAASLARAALSNALQGAAVGLCATIVAGAAAAAGALFDAAVASQTLPVRDVFGESGPIAGLSATLFAWFLMGSGGFERLVTACISGPGGTPHVQTVALLGSAFLQIALSAGAPALAAQAFATIVAALIARMAPRINSLFLGAPITSILGLCALVIGGTAFVTAIAEIAWRTAIAPLAMRP
ncbi:MAG TPA: flagellar biosynthetic protein FliR [Candidatus Eremiobacteraceae bacterium]|nr:flagellar biosynthetic protein FliR [Candidatus Eremiobacteraceae bacterium]